MDAEDLLEAGSKRGFAGDHLAAPVQRESNQSSDRDDVAASDCRLEPAQQTDFSAVVPAADRAGRHVARTAERGAGLDEVESG
jgi:hypothetical protein